MSRLKYILFLILFIGGNAEAQYWQQKLAYRIDVTLNPVSKTLDGFERLTYRNESPDTLRFIWFHLWPNAYKNDKTAFSEQMLQHGNTAFYFSGNAEKGYINRLDFKVDGIPAKMEDHPEHIDIIRLILPKPLLPGQETVITTPFHVKLPFNFSRSGFAGTSFAATQWYPKPAVYDRKGWHPMPYLNQGEFYSEFGSFDVRITAPVAYTVAATGRLQGELGRLFMGNIYRGFSFSPDKGTGLRNVSDSTYTWQYLQDSVHDFAWFADKNFIVDHDTVVLASRRVVDVFHYYHPQKKVLKNAKQEEDPGIGFAKDAIRFYSAEVGEYPYSTVSVVDGPESFGGGMEYPTITVISPMPNRKLQDIVIAHEIGHNWFYGILASNERAHPWMDEGLNSFYERKYTRQKYGPLQKEEELLFQSIAQQHRDQLITASSTEMSYINYALVAYQKTANWLEWMEGVARAESFRYFMQQYYAAWKFAHPYPEDFDKQVREKFPEHGAQFLEVRGKKGLIPGTELKGFKLMTPLKPSSFTDYLTAPSKHALLVSPAAGYNAYDKFMIGALVSNHKLPSSPLQFIAVPLYATGSKQLNGIGRISFTAFPKKGVQKIELFSAASKFSNNEFSDEEGKKHIASFNKIVPGATMVFREKDPHSKKMKWIQWKSYFISEQPFRIGFDSIFTPGDTLVQQTVNKTSLRYNVHQFTATLENGRALYPYSLQFKAQGSDKFLRLTAEANYFFNYKEGGLSARLFAGKFIYDEHQDYPYGYYIGRFMLNMTGANGEEDFTYSDYFVGRNKFEGLESQQIAIRDGGFKTRTDLLASEVGKSDDWLAAINLRTSIPKRLNPLSVLPVKIPIYLFADIGTEASAWTENRTSDRFMFDGGLQVSLFSDVLNIYFPIVYSRPFGDYVKSVYEKNRFIKTASFSIDIQRLSGKMRNLLYLLP